MQPNKYGFYPKEWDDMQHIFKKYSEIEEVILFGSRAKQAFKKASDVDIAIKGDNVTHDTILHLQNDFEDSYIPYFFDVLRYSTISSGELKEHIRIFGVEIYKK